MTDEGKSLLPADKEITTLHVISTLKQIAEIMYKKVCSLSVAGFLSFVFGFSSILHAQVFVAQKFKAVPNFRSTTAPIRLLSVKSQTHCALLCTLGSFVWEPTIVRREVDVSCYRLHMGRHNKRDGHLDT